MPRFHCPTLLATGAELDLPPGAARHVQVLRLQPGDTITLFHGGQAEGDPGGEFDATVLKMGRSDVRVVVGAHHATEREAPRAVHLLAGITANERMDWLVEKATELGVASITPPGPGHHSAAPAAVAARGHGAAAHGGGPGRARGVSLRPRTRALQHRGRPGTATQLCPGHAGPPCAARRDRTAGRLGGTHPSLRMTCITPCDR